MKPFSLFPKSHFLLKSLIVPLALLGTASLGHGTTTFNLLVDPSFEAQASLPSYSTVVNNFSSSTQGLWGAENGAFVGAENSVIPQGSRMLRMQDDGLTSTQTIQITSLAAFASDIAAGSATYNMSAYFNSSADVGAPVATIAVTFFTSNWNSRFGGSSTSLVLDTNPSTWAQLSKSGTIPVGAAWIGTEVSFPNAPLGDFDGYVDEASLTVTTIPETSSVTLGLVAAGLLLRRKRR